MPIVIRMPSIREWEEREGVECTRFYLKYVGLMRFPATAAPTN